MDHEKENEKDPLFALHSCSDTLLIEHHEVSVKNLQNCLFPITPRKSYSAESYLSSTFLKKTQLREDEEKKLVDSYSYIRNRDSKELFTKDYAPNEHVDQPPRWPTECQVIEERVKHIPYKPCPPEPYYVPTGNEVQPKPIGEESGIIVYQYYPISAVSYFCRSSIGGSKYLLPTCPTPEVESLRFESRFESGNLAKAIKITANYYELYLRTDMYTNRHMQWYYFRISNMRKCLLYRFSIVNFTKVDSLYTEGMQPLMYSEKDAHMHSVGWRRCGSNISYFCNDNGAEEEQEQLRYHTLTFTLEFPHDDDVVYLAHSYPYTYSDLQDHLLEIAAHPVKSTYTTLRLLCKTLAGNNVYYVTVTTPPGSETSSTNKLQKKKAIVITARVHPGETPSSWMMHGFLDFLTSDTGPAKELRDSFIFKLVPMLNPDGVIVGNNRCSLSGKDLNRQYRTVIRETYPSIWYTKLMIRRLVEECGVAMYCDLHAHSKKHNIFIFGCENKRAVDRKLYEQVFPLMLHKNASEKNCKFRIQKCKEGTGRVVMWMMGIANSFTMEASFGGTTMGARKETHFNTLDFEQMGKTFCQTLLDFYDDDPRKERLRMKIINRLLKQGSSADEPANIRLSDYSSDGGDTTSSSDDDEKPRMLPNPTSAPPPTPTKIKKCLIPKLNVPKIHLKSPSRKPLDMCKANFVFSGHHHQNSSDESSQSDSEFETRKEKKPARRKKRKPKKKVQKKLPSIDFLDSDIRLGRDYAVIDILPDMKFTTKQSKKDAQHKYFIDQKRQNNHQRLMEVQSKLLALKNKLWFGIGDVDPHRPLSWEKNSSTKPQSRPQSNNEKRPPVKKIQKPKEEIKLPKRQRENLRRQTAVEFSPLIKGTVKLRKTKSLTDGTKKDAKLGRSNTYKSINLSHSEKDDDEVTITKPKTKKNKTKAAKIINKS